MWIGVFWFFLRKRLLGASCCHFIICTFCEAPCLIWKWIAYKSYWSHSVTLIGRRVRTEDAFLFTVPNWPQNLVVPSNLDGFERWSSKSPQDRLDVGFEFHLLIVKTTEASHWLDKTELGIIHCGTLCINLQEKYYVQKPTNPILFILLLC